MRDGRARPERKIVDALRGLGAVAIFLSLHLMERWPSLALAVAVVGGIVWLAGEGAVLLEA